MDLEVDYNKYCSKLDIAENIYKEMFGEPKTAQEKADRYNKIGTIIRIILKEEKL